MTSQVDASFRWAHAAAGRILRCEPLSARASHLFTSRDASFRGPEAAGDYDRLAASFGLTRRECVVVKQVHGRAVLVVRPGTSPEPIEADAIVSTDPSRVIAVRIADCVPILIADAGGRVVAAVHAGWRGTCAGVAGATVEAIRTLRVEPDDLMAVLGPSIGPCCYRVDERVRAAFPASDWERWAATDGPEHWRLDLWRANRDQLVSAGVPASAIHVAGLCTAHHLESCFSYRAEGPDGGRMVAAIRSRA